MISDVILAVNLIKGSLGWVDFFLVTFKIYSLSLLFEWLIRMHLNVSRCIQMWLLFYLNFVRLLGIVNVFHQIWDIVSHRFFECLLCLFPLLLGLSFVNVVGTFDGVPQVSEALFNFLSFFSFFFLSSRLSFFIPSPPFFLPAFLPFFSPSLPPFLSSFLSYWVISILPIVRLTDSFLPVEICHCIHLVNFAF